MKNDGISLMRFSTAIPSDPKDEWYSALVKLMKFSRSAVSITRAADR